MTTPGVSLRPVVGLHGSHLFNPVYLDGVRVPIGHRVGPENGGWTIAKPPPKLERPNLARVAEALREAGVALAERRVGLANLLGDEACHLERAGPA